MPRYAPTPLNAPYAEEVDTYFLTMNNRLRSDQLQPGQVEYSVNGRMDLDGSWQTRKGVEAFGPLLSSSAAALTIPFYLYANKVISAASRVNTVVTVTTSTNHGFVDATQVSISGISGTVDPTGNRTITVTGLDTFTFVIAGATGSETYTLGGTPQAGAPIISSAVNAVYGSCRFSDPSDDNDEYIIVATNDSARAINLITEASTTIAYPTGISITQPVELLQAFGKVYIFRDGATALEWNGSFSGSPAFTKVANGNYTQPLVLSTANNAACTGGVVTVTNTHNLAVGDKVVIMDEGTTGLVRFDTYTVTSISTTVSFTFYASVDDFTATSVVLGIRQSNGRGYTHMPAPPWAAYHQRRLIVPYSYTTTGSSGSETVTARNVTDELLFSDVLDGDTYDILQNQFRVTAGVADYIQAVHPFTEDAAIAFNRNSIHLIQGLTGSLTDVTIKMITREAGLVARKSVVTIGNSIFFLSDNGVYSTDFGDLYNLRGAGLPLSDAINPLIKRINWDYAHRAVGIFHDNRYWLAVPMDSSVVNNAILVYNVLNKGWESMDTIDQVGWDIANFIVGSPVGVNILFAVNSYGGLHKLDSREDDNDRIYTLPGIAAAPYAIESYLTTRMFTLGSAARKKYNAFELHVESTDTNASNATLAATSENSDVAVDLGTLAALNGAAVIPVSEDASLRGRIGGVRSYGLQYTITPTAGRPKIRMIKTIGCEAFRSTTQAT